MPTYLKIIFIIIFALNLSAQIIDKIDVVGNKNFTRSDYISWAKISSGNKVFPSVVDSIKKRITENLILNGYYNSDLAESKLIIQPDSQKANLFIKIEEGEPTFLKNIFLSGIAADSNIFLQDFDFLKDKIFIKSELENSISNILNYYEENGFPFSKVKITSANFFIDSLENKHYADVYLKIDTGKVSRIDKVEIKGNTKTKDYVIIRDTRISKGTLYSQKQIEEIPNKLNRLRFFDPVETPSFFFNSKNEGVLLIQLKEKETNNFDGLIGYVPGNQKEQKGYITGLVNVSLRNLFGTGRAAAFKWQRIDRYSQELEVKFLEPWVLGFPFNLNAGFLQQKQDTSYVQRKFEGAVEFLASEDLSASVTIAAESVIPTESDYSVFTVYNSSSLTTGLSVKIDSRDDYYSPTKGIYFLNSYSFSQKKINGPEKYFTSTLIRNINLQRFAIDFQLYQEIIKRQVVAIGIHGREMQGTFFEVSDLFKLGGTNTLRGYRENQFLGNRLLWSNLENRFLLSKRTYAFLFFDSGYYLRNADSKTTVPKISSIKLGYGLGLNIETGLGVLSVSYALANGDSFGQGKIHFGLINEF
ncbi:MAG: BamA/TamA family outer membrane protein [Ignavibacteriales bacterium]|nr:BamA/TamA family outer membrane protein [Ignavibacteriales bacterium]